VKKEKRALRKEGLRGGGGVQKESGVDRGGSESVGRPVVRGGSSVIGGKEDPQGEGSVV